MAWGRGRSVDYRLFFKKKSNSWLFVEKVGKQRQQYQNCMKDCSQKTFLNPDIFALSFYINTLLSTRVVMEQINMEK